MFLEPVPNKLVFPPNGLDNRPALDIGPNRVLEGAAPLHDPLRGRVDALIFVIECDQPVVGVEQREPFLQALDGAAKPLLAGAKRLFGVTAFGDVRFSHDDTAIRCPAFLDDEAFAIGQGAKDLALGVAVAFHAFADMFFFVADGICVHTAVNVGSHEVLKEHPRLEDIVHLRMQAPVLFVEEH